jgi:peptidoglycan/LPS O-acetylase OafA/YrhL
LDDHAASPDGRGRIAGIDVLRGLAASFVVLHHIHLRFQIHRYDVAGALPQMLERVLFWSGYYSVIGFFVISGFLIASLSLSRWGSFPALDWRRFYWLRATRILPCLLLLLAVLSLLHLLGAPGFAIDPRKATLGRALLAALTFHFNWLEGQVGYLPGGWDVLWSLSVEELFYLFFPLVCVATRREGWVLACCAILIVLGPLNRVALEGRRPWDDYAYLSCMDGMAWGCAAAWVSARLRPSRRALRAALVAGVAAILLVIVFRHQTSLLQLPQLGLNVTLLEAGTALVLLALAGGVGNGALSRGTGWLQAIGRCSYEVYLTHMFVILGLMHVIDAQRPKDLIPVWYVVLFAGSIGLGHALHRVYSEPMNRLGRRRA